MERNLRMSLKEWLPFFGVVLMLTSCTEDERLPQTEDGYGLKLESVSLYEGGTSTRALLTDVDAVGLYLTKQNHAEYGSNPRCVYTRAGGGWSAGDNAPKINSANGGDAIVYAFHPSGLTVTREASGNHTVPVSVVAADDFLAASQTDYLLNWHSSTTPFTETHLGEGQPACPEIGGSYGEADLEESGNTQSNKPYSDRQWGYESGYGGVVRSFLNLAVDVDSFCRYGVGY